MATNAASSSRQATAGTKSAAQRKARIDHDAARLNAVNGKHSASKVGPGQRPEQGKWVDNDNLIYPCSICARRFARVDNVKSHMATCVKRNGNPHSAFWDDAIKASRRASSDDGDGEDEESGEVQGGDEGEGEGAEIEDEYVWEDSSEEEADEAEVKVEASEDDEETFSTPEQTEPNDSEDEVYEIPLIQID